MTTIPEPIAVALLVADALDTLKVRYTKRPVSGMNETVVRAAGLGIAIVYACLIAWLFVRQPATFAEVTGGLSSAVGAYRVDQQAFDDGLRYFRNDQFSRGARGVRTRGPGPPRRAHAVLHRLRVLP